MNKNNGNNIIESLTKTKQTIITSRLARAFFMSKEGDKIPAISDYAQIFSVGSGTVQSAFLQLKQIGAIQVETKGFLGSYIKKIDHRKLWELSDFGNLFGLFPFKKSVGVNRLSTAVKDCFQKQGIDAHVSYMPGSINRIKALQEEKCDFAVISEFSFKNAVKEGVEIAQVCSFGEKTYRTGIGYASLKTPKEVKQEKVVVGIKSGSYDYNEVMKLLVDHNKNYFFKYIDIGNEISSLENGEINKIVLDKNEIEGYSRELLYESIEDDIVPLIPGFDKAVLVVNVTNDDLRRILIKLLRACEFMS